MCFLGLDIPSVQLVVNHNVPSNPKEYVHRVGRTTRAGRGGFSLILITPHDIKLLHTIEVRIAKKLQEHKINGLLHLNSLLKFHHVLILKKKLSRKGSRPNEDCHCCRCFLTTLKSI